MGRLTSGQLSAAVADLDTIITEVDLIERTADLAHMAGELAQAHGLRGYDSMWIVAL